MKKVIISAALLLSIITLNSCSNSVLDQDPILGTTDKNIFSSKEKIESNLLGVYTKAKEILALRGHVFVEAIGDDFINLSVNTNEAYASYEMAVGLGTLDNSDFWTGAYSAINNVNTFLENLENSKEIAGNDYNRYVAEAKFVRALCYYYLNDLYAKPYVLDNNAKSVPLRLVAENTINNNDLARSSVTEVYNQIFADLSDANLSALPSTTNDYTSVTRATQNAVRMLRMRCYMEQGLWEKAIIEGENVKGYSLLENLGTVFSSPYISNENIFSFPMADTNKGTTQSAFAYFTYNGSRFVIDTKSGVYSKPLYSQQADQRVSRFISKAGTQTISTKFSDAQNYLNWIPVFRFAETKLNLAESYYNLGSEDLAKQYLSEVRRRSISQGDDLLDINTLSGEVLFEAIDNERRTEFIGEAIRSLDILRRGETFYKQKGTPQAITTTPTTNGYTWPIPTVERVINKLIVD